MFCEVCYAIYDYQLSCACLLVLPYLHTHTHGYRWTKFQTVHEAKDLAAADSCGTSDPYVFVHFDQAKAKTKVVKKTLAPKWEQELTLEGEGTFLPLNHAYSVVETVLEINVYDKDRFSKDDVSSWCTKFSFAVFHHTLL